MGLVDKLICVVLDHKWVDVADAARIYDKRCLRCPAVKSGAYKRYLDRVRYDF